MKLKVHKEVLSVFIKRILRIV